MELLKIVQCNGDCGDDCSYYGSDAWEQSPIISPLFSSLHIFSVCPSQSMCFFLVSTCFWQKQTLSLIDSYLTAVLCNACIPSSRLVTTQLLDVWPLQWHCIQLLKQKVRNLAVVWAVVHLLPCVSFTFCKPASITSSFGFEQYFPNKNSKT